MVTVSCGIPKEQRSYLLCIIIIISWEDYSLEDHHCTVTEVTILVVSYQYLFWKKYFSHVFVKTVTQGFCLAFL